ncbi:hypothetical protein D9M73_184850 [compost metagenome]
MGAGLFHDRNETRQAFADRAIDVALGKRFGRCREHGNFLDPSGQRILEAAQVGRQGGIGHPGFALDLCKHLGRAAHLRYPLGRNETAYLDVTQACVREVIDQAHLVGNTDGLGFILQAIARANLDQAYVLWQ